MAVFYNDSESEIRFSSLLVYRSQVPIYSFLLLLRLAIPLVSIPYSLIFFFIDKKNRKNRQNRQMRQLKSIQNLMMLSFILFFQLRDTGLYTRLCHLVGWSNHFLPLTCISMYVYVSVCKKLCRIRNMLLRMRHRGVAYAT